MWLYRIACLIVVLCLGVPPAARAAPAAGIPLVPLDGLRHDSWTETKGAPGGIEVMAQTPDGWIWLVSGTRLMRFDGLAFHPFVPADGGRLQSATTAMAADDAGRLYLGNALGGLAVVEGGRMRHVADSRTIGTVFKVAIGRDGAVWIAANNGLHRYVNGRFERIDEGGGYPPRRAEYVHIDGGGNVWALSGTALYRRAAGAPRFVHVRAAQSDGQLLDSPDGRVWLFEHQDQMLTAVGDAAPPVRRQAIHNDYQSLFDRDGNFWTGNCLKNVCRIPAAALHGRAQVSTRDPLTERLSQPWQLTSIGIAAVMQDREGNVWVGTARGLDRFRDGAVRMVPGLDGRVDYIAAVENGNIVWVCNEDVDGTSRIWRIEGGRATEQPNPAGFNAVGHGDGSILFAGPKGILRRTAGGTTSIALPENANRVRSIRYPVEIGEDAGGVHIALQSEGVFTLRDGTWRKNVYPGQRSPQQRVVDARGRVWDGLRHNRLAVTDPRGTRLLTAAHGVGVGTVEFIQTAPDFLISGGGGLQVFHDGRFATLGLESSGESPFVEGMATDTLGGRWLNTTSGLFHVARPDWERTMRDPAVPLRARKFDQVDGYRGTSSMSSPWGGNAFATSDGRIWLTTTSGMAWLDPRRMPRNDIAPRVELLQLRANDRIYRPGEIAAFAPDTQKLAITYTAPMYTMPERVSFRYRLHGVDRNWQDVGQRREAIYTNLGPGKYRFEVVAINEDGVAGRPALSPSFVIKPTFVQTPWFALLLLALAALVLYLAYRLRMRQLTRRFIERSLAQLDERERIARTLHDSFLQNVQVLLLRIHGAAAKLPSGDPARTLLENALEDGQRTLTEGRDEVQALRRELPDGAGIAAALREDAAAADASCAIHVEGELDLPDGEQAAEVFAIAREALRNAIRHAGANHIRIVLGTAAGQAELTVADDGHGMPAAMAEGQGPAGHFGLTGMRERAAKIGGELTIASTAAGTTVRLALPLSRHDRRSIGRYRRTG